jgi:hypothetical protein
MRQGTHGEVLAVVEGFGGVPVGERVDELFANELGFRRGTLSSESPIQPFTDRRASVTLM